VTVVRNELAAGGAFKLRLVGYRGDHELRVDDGPQTTAQPSIWRPVRQLKAHLADPVVRSGPGRAHFARCSAVWSGAGRTLPGARRCGVAQGALCPARWQFRVAQRARHQVPTTHQAGRGTRIPALILKLLPHISDKPRPYLQDRRRKALSGQRRPTSSEDTDFAAVAAEWRLWQSADFPHRWRSSQRPVWIMNGLARPYRALIGQMIRLGTKDFRGICVATRPDLTRRPATP